jgi:hypothetical protein
VQKNKEVKINKYFEKTRENQNDKYLEMERLHVYYGSDCMHDNTVQLLNIYSWRRHFIRYIYIEREGGRATS